MFKAMLLACSSTTALLHSARTRHPSQLGAKKRDYSAGDWLVKTGAVRKIMERQGRLW